MKRSSIFLLIGGLAFAFSGNSYAGSITYDNSLTANISGVSTYDTTGNSMTGMQVTVSFTGGGSEMATWNDISNGLSTGALGTGWSLTLNNYSYSTYPEEVNHAQWILSTTTSIDSIMIEALPGNAFFDVVYTPIDTPNSGYGWAISDADTYPNYGQIANFDALYSEQVNVPSYSGISGYPWDDLFSTLTLQAIGGNGPLLASQTGAQAQLTFFADTDNTSAIPDVPEPMSLLLFGTGLLGLGGYQLKRKR